MPVLDSPSASAVPETYWRWDHLRRWKVLAGILLFFLASGAGGGLLVMQPLLTSPRGEAAIPVEVGRLEAHVRYLSEACLPRDWRGPGLAKAADYIETAFQKSGGRVSRQAFEVRGRASANVIATFGPEDGPRLVVGAHYDAHGELPGADDNASGVACLLELARAFGRAAPAQRVDLVAYTLEEPPFFRTPEMGSVRHARLLKDTGAEVAAVIVLEMVGRFTEAPHSQRYPSSLLELVYPDRGNFLLVAGRFDDIGLTRQVKAAMRGTTPLPVKSLNGPRWVPGMDFSDHYPYWDQGFTAVMVTDTAFYRNTDYHTDRDTADRLDYARMAQVVQGVHATVTRLAKRAH
ncbi:M28 family peptidase [Geothrix fuzhouensis]|uniref:M28 family peptidase n=1 Tax=Geothrix fuzhouensis TaxID=2966451 RepID=UPI0021492E33|nr:M28 family peptidase [Geothrix fuzhouensis]